MPSITVFTSLAYAFYAILRYLRSLFAIFSSSQADIESGAQAGGVAPSGSHDTDSSSFYCQDIGDYVWTGPFAPQATSPPRRTNLNPKASSPVRGSRPSHLATVSETGHGASRTVPDACDQSATSIDIGCVPIVSIEPQFTVGVVSDMQIPIISINKSAGDVPLGADTDGSVMKPCGLMATRPPQRDNVRLLVNLQTSSAAVREPRSALLLTPGPSSPCGSGSPPSQSVDVKKRTTSAPKRQPLKSTSFAENRGYNKFIQLNGIVTPFGARSTLAVRNRTPSPAQQLAQFLGSPASELSLSTPLPRYTPTNPDFQISGDLLGPPSVMQQQAPSYLKAQPDRPRAAKRKVVLSYVVAQKATISTQEPRTPMCGEIAIQHAPAGAASEPVNTLVAEVLSRLKQESPESVHTKNACLRPLLLPQDIANRKTSVLLKAEVPRPLLLPRQLSKTATGSPSLPEADETGFNLRVSPPRLDRREEASTQPKHLVSHDDVSVRSVSVYSQGSWQEVGSSSSLACTFGSEGDISGFDEIGFHPALQAVLTSHKRRAICMTDAKLSS
ncbi:hypothetical protein BDW22DRAFT_1420219 [Trametopsis cervina]|nr:hypothetical protein BDW22DRAFT_1420219 [Trametopsis cervina]